MSTYSDTPRDRAARLTRDAERLITDALENGGPRADYIARLAIRDADGAINSALDSPPRPGSSTSRAVPDELARDPRPLRLERDC
jgi:hypothetical protein